MPYIGGYGDGISNHYNSPQDSVLTAFALHADCAILNDTLLDDDAMTVIRWHDCDCSVNVLQYMTRDGGHSWPGGVQSPLGDPPSQTINANDLMWGFFQQHQLDCISTGSIEPPITTRAFEVLPTVSDGAILVKGEAIVSLRVVDPLGRLAFFKQYPPSESLTIDLTSLAPGRYLLLAILASGEQATASVLLH